MVLKVKSQLKVGENREIKKALYIREVEVSSRRYRQKPFTRPSMVLSRVIG
jgi:hypothetical protein